MATIIMIETQTIVECRQLCNLIYRNNNCFNFKCNNLNNFRNTEFNQVNQACNLMTTGELLV